MIDNNLKHIREELELTQTELGNILGVHNSTVRGWENAYDTMPLSRLVMFSNKFNYSIDYVLGLSKVNTSYDSDIVLNKKDISMKLKKLRKDLGLSQQEIADKCSISRGCYSHYEIGISLITTLTLYTLCKTYNLSIDEFLR